LKLLWVPYLNKDDLKHVYLVLLSHIYIKHDHLKFLLTLRSWKDVLKMSFNADDNDSNCDRTVLAVLALDTLVDVTQIEP
jgi:hypothetical protein